MSITLDEAKHITSDSNIKDFFDSLDETYTIAKEELGEERAKAVYEQKVINYICSLVECYQAHFISLTQYRELNKKAGSYLEKMDSSQVVVSSNGNIVATSNGEAPLSQRRPEYYRNYRLGCLLTPPNLEELPVLSFSRIAFVAPETIDLRDYCVRTPNQEDLPWCAAFAACSFASNVLWRKTDCALTFDPKPHYEYAKKIDGKPDEDGTTLVAVLQSLLYHNQFSSQHSQVKVLRTKEQVKYAIHKFGCCLLGLMVTKEWYTCNSKKSTISGKNGSDFLGGHAVLACGYTRDGVIIQNSWGPEWGSYGFALITWEEFEREFSYGAVLDNCLYDTKMN